MDFRITEEVTKQDISDVFQGLLEYNNARTGGLKPKKLGIFFENESGEKLAGLIGYTYGNWLTVEYLWVSESLRGQHIGRRMLAQAENTARERGCRYVFLDTFSFQAPDFYRKHGFQEVFALQEYPLIHKRHYFTKIL